MTTLVNWQPKTIKWGEWENEFVLTYSCDNDSLLKFTHKRSQWFCFYLHDKKDCQESRMKKWTMACKRILDEYLLAPHKYNIKKSVKNVRIYEKLRNFVKTTPICLVFILFMSIFEMRFATAVATAVGNHNTYQAEREGSGRENKSIPRFPDGIADSGRSFRPAECGMRILRSANKIQYIV